MMGPVLERFTIGLPVKLHFGPANRILVVQNRLGAVERGYERLTWSVQPVSDRDALWALHEV